MADTIQASLDREKLQAPHPGDTATAEITIRNAGASPDRYRMEMEGLPPAWCQLVYVDAVVAPRQQHTARLVIRTPATASADIYEFTLSVLSANDPEQRTRVKGTLQIGETEAIGVSLQATRLQILQDGGSAQTVIAIENKGTILDRYVVEVVGLEPSWYSLSSAGEIPLVPGETKEVTLVVSPPAGGAARGGVYTFTVTARSRVDLTKTGRAQAVLQVAEHRMFALRLDPGKVTGRTGSYKVIVDNSGNTDLDLTLEAGDTHGACEFTFTPKTLHLANGQQETVQLSVTAPRSNLFGRQKNYNFQVRGKPSQGQPQSIPGEFVHSPLVHPGRALVVVPVLVAATAVVAGGYPPVRSMITETLCQRAQVLCSSILYSHLTHAVNGFPNPGLLGQGLAQPTPGNGNTTLQPTTNGLIVADPAHQRTFFIPKDTVIYQYQDGVATKMTGPHLLLGHTLPTDPALPVSGTVHLYDATTQHNLEEPMWDYWKQWPDLLGHPQTEPFCERGSHIDDPVLHPKMITCARGWTLVQYTDRFRLEDAHGQVTIAPLGRRLSAGLNDPALSPVSSASCAALSGTYYAETAHCLYKYFKDYLAQQPTIKQLLGPPISEPELATISSGDRHQYEVQWFMFGRLEYHPGTGDTNDVVVSTLGLLDLHNRGWLT